MEHPGSWPEAETRGGDTPDDWRTAQTQIAWGLDYIKDRYGGGADGAGAASADDRSGGR